MPEVLLSSSTARPVVRSRAKWTVTGSCLLHAVLAVTILISPVLGSATLPAGGGASVLSTGRWAPPPVVVPPKPDGPIRPGGKILPPARTGYTAPVYPPIAIQARRDGTVILEAVIDETGVVRDVIVLRSVPLLDRAAIDAVRQWRYSPTRLNGEPVAIIMTVSVTFTLK